MRLGYLVAAGLALSPVAVLASETINYTYDAKGRLTNVAHVGGREDGMAAAYAYDPADNRTTTQVSGAHGRVIVVPLGRLQPIVVR